MSSLRFGSAGVCRSLSASRSSARRLDDPAEPEQLVLDLVEAALLLCGDQMRDDAAPSRARCRGPASVTSAARRPPRRPARPRRTRARGERRGPATPWRRPGTAGSLIARRSGGCVSRMATTAKRSSPSCDASALRPLLPPRRRRRRRARRRLIQSTSATRSPGRARLGLRLEVGDEAVDRAAAPGVVLERLTDDRLCQDGGDAADLGRAAG